MILTPWLPVLIVGVLLIAAAEIFDKQRFHVFWKIGAFVCVVAILLLVAALLGWHP